MISETEMVQFEFNADHNLHLRHEAHVAFTRLIAEVRSLRLSAEPTNGFFRVSRELLHEVFQLPIEIAIVAAQVIEHDGTIRFLIRDLGFPCDEPAVEYELYFERVPNERRLKNIARLSISGRGEA